MMNKKLILGAMLMTSAAISQASTWHYANDSQNDGSGGSTYEGYGMAYSAQGSKLIFALNTNFGPTGHALGGVLNDRISNGDLFLNFSGHNLTAASDFNDPKVFAVRFDSTNDDGVTGTGLFGNVTPIGHATQNSGYGSLGQYTSSGFGRTSNAMGDLQDNVNAGGDVRSYLGNGEMLPNISSGRLISGVTMLSQSDLTGMGMNTAGWTGLGSNVYGFSIDRASVPQSGFVGHQFEECINDGMGIKGSAVPAPGALATFIVGIAGALRRRKSA